MVAGIQEHDIMRFRDRAAWHSFGQLVFEDETPVEAYRAMTEGEDRSVIQYRVKAYHPTTGHEIEMPDRRLNVRSDTLERVGHVSSDYKVCQDLVLCEFSELLAKGDDRVVVESMGTILGGKVFWVLVRGESYSVRGDEVKPYICFVNSHDGKMSIQAVITAIRAQCFNTLSQIFPEMRDGAPGLSLRQGRFSCVHTGDLQSKLDEAREALMLYEHAVKSTQEISNEIADKPVKSEQELRQYFFDCYEANFGEIPTMPKTRGEATKRNRAMSAFDSFSRRWDDERAIGGDNLWSAFNAYTGMVQHDQKAKGKDDRARVEKRQHSNLFGLNNERSIAAMELALNM